MYKKINQQKSNYKMTKKMEKKSNQIKQNKMDNKTLEKT